MRISDWSSDVCSSDLTAPKRSDEVIKVVGLRRKIAENMAEANRRIPHFALVEEFDVTALEDARSMMNRDRGSNPKRKVLPFSSEERRVGKECVSPCRSRWQQ